MNELSEAATATLLEVSCVQQVTRLQAIYGEIVDGCVTSPHEGWRGQLRTLFTPEAKMNFPGLLGQIDGIDQIEKLFAETIPSQVVWLWHAFHSPLITVTGNSATAHWTLHNLIVRKGLEDKEPELVYGRYFNRYVRTPDGWRQSELFFRNETRSVVISNFGHSIRELFDNGGRPQ